MTGQRWNLLICDGCGARHPYCACDVPHQASVSTVDVVPAERVAELEAKNENLLTAYGHAVQLMSNEQRDTLTALLQESKTT